MDMDTESTSCDSSDSGSVHAWQSQPVETRDDGDLPDYTEEIIAEAVNNWLTQHGTSLFNLQTSKFLAREKKKIPTCSLKTPFKPPRQKTVNLLDSD